MLVLLSNALKTGCGEPLILEPNAKVFNPTTCCSIQVGCDMSREPTSQRATAKNCTVRCCGQSNFKVVLDTFADWLLYIDTTVAHIV